MCGIGFVLGPSPADQTQLENCISALKRRGPDADKQTVIDLKRGRELHLLAAVLHLRGDRLCSQPAEDGHGNVLLWNGEVFDGLDVKPSESDTAKVLQALSRTRSHEELVATLGCISGPFSLVYWCPARRALYYGRDPVGRRSLVVRKPRAPGESLAVLSCLPETDDQPAAATHTSPVQAPGPPPPALHHHHHHRQQQPQASSEDERLPACSENPKPEADVKFEAEAGVSRGKLDVTWEWEEVRADGIYVLRVDDDDNGDAVGESGGVDGGDILAPAVAAAVIAAVPCPELYPWSRLRGAPVAVSEEKEEEPRVPPVTSPEPSDSERLRWRAGRGAEGGTAAAEGGCAAGEAGGGARKIEGQGKQEQVVEEEAGRILDGRTDDQGNGGKRERQPAAATAERSGHVSAAAAGLFSRLRGSIRRRVRTIPYPGAAAEQTCRGDRADGRHDREASDLGKETSSERRLLGGDLGGAVRPQAGGVDQGAALAAPPPPPPFPPLLAAARVGVLFSGGLDSVVLAAMLAEEEGGRRPTVPKGEAIDLINVCFDSPSGHQSPDRLASIAAADELSALFPSHVWRLVCVDASYDDVLRRTAAVWRVMQPCSTTMDFNIAAAFWFASRGTGWVYRPLPRPVPAPCPPCDHAGVGATEGEGGGSPRGSTTVPEAQRENGAVSTGGAPAATATTLPVLHPASPAAAADDDAAVRAGLSVGSGDLADGTPRKDRGTNQVSPDTPPAANVDLEEVGTKSSVGSSSSSSGSKGRNVPKVNKNSDELCPVDGCRRLLRPGCVFNTCSRCCLKAQGLVDAAAGAAGAALASASPLGSPPGAEPEPAEGTTAAAAVEVERTADPPAAAAAGSASERQRACKAHAEAEAVRALEAHLLDLFDAELSPPFRPEALAALLLPSREKANSALRQPAGRDRHRPPPRAPNSGAWREPVKWCPTHKKPRQRMGRDGSGGSAAPAATAAGLGSGEEGAGGWPVFASADVYTSAARVLLVGIGADEFMGGYSRHRNAFNRGGAKALTEELLKDQGRLWTRNLGRDDRTIADHGREARFPFLDEEVVGYIRSLPLRDVCDMDEPTGVGDKKILREVATHLGLDSCRSLPKRAIQFGSRIAQHCARRTHGSHRRGSGSDPASAAGACLPCPPPEPPRPVGSL